MMAFKKMMGMVVVSVAALGLAACATDKDNVKTKGVPRHVWKQLTPAQRHQLMTYDEQQNKTNRSYANIEAL